MPYKPFTALPDGSVAFHSKQKRDLSARRYIYLWADGVYLQARMEANAECMLVLIGATSARRNSSASRPGVGCRAWPARA